MNKIYKNIDQLIADGHGEDACILIEEVWKKRASDNQEKIAKLILRLEQLQCSRHAVQEKS